MSFERKVSEFRLSNEILLFFPRLLSEILNLILAPFFGYFNDPICQNVTGKWKMHISKMAYTKSSIEFSSLAQNFDF